MKTAEITLPGFQHDVMAATFETLAHLELAYVEGRAQKTERNGRLLFQAR